MLSREWATAGELAGLGLPEMPDERAIRFRAKREQWQRPEWRNVRWRKRQASGGGIEYHHSVLPLAAQAAWVGRFGGLSVAEEQQAAEGSAFAADWRAFASRSGEQQRVALARLQALADLVALEASGLPKDMARHRVMDTHGVTKSTLYRWRDAVRGIPRTDWLPFLAPDHAGSARRAECSDEAWQFFTADFLRAEKPSAQSVYRRLLGVAAIQGWAVPSLQTLLRRVESDIDAVVRVRRREGEQAVKRMFPAQERNRDVFVALEAVNTDGHQIDVFVQWGDKVIRPTILVFQDLYSDMILSWRVDESENKELVRLAFGDVVERWGVPEVVYLDNGRAYASKWITGGVQKRNRFKVKQDELDGVMTQLGTRAVFVTPYSGQSKPIERSFKDVADNIAKDPRFAGAYVGNKPEAKPHNYGSKAIPLERFLQVFEEGIVEHNNRVGRDTRACRRVLSFRQAFDASYAKTTPRKVSEHQRRLFLMPGEYLTARKPDGALHLMGNRYHAPFLWQHMGEKLQVRFDPQQLHADLFVYTNDGRFLGEAPCIHAVGFNDIEAAQKHLRARKAFMRATRAADEAAAGMAIEQVQELLDKAAPSTAPAPAPETKIVRLVQGNTVRHVAVSAVAELEDDLPEEDRENTEVLRAWREGRVGLDRLVRSGDDN